MIELVFVGPGQNAASTLKRLKDLARKYNIKLGTLFFHSWDSEECYHMSCEGKAEEFLVEALKEPFLFRDCTRHSPEDLRSLRELLNESLPAD